MLNLIIASPPSMKIGKEVLLALGVNKYLRRSKLKIKICRRVKRNMQGIQLKLELRTKTILRLLARKTFIK